MNLYTLSLAALIVLACNDGDNSNVEDTVKTEPIAAVADNTLSTEEKNEGWDLLFDGSTVAGWHSYNQKTDASAWKVKDGVLFLDTSVRINGKVAGGDIVTDKVYKNFHLKLDWKLEPKGNSGIMFHVLEDPAITWSYMTGPEMQILDNDGHPDAKIRTHRAGDLYDMIECSQEVAKPIGEWNTAEIIINNSTLTFVLNGVKVVETTLWDDNWNQLIAKSKFKNLPQFGNQKEGRIALQDHGDPVYFKNIKIKELN